VKGNDQRRVSIHCNYFNAVHRNLVVIVALTCASCATTLTRKTYPLRISSTSANAQLEYNDSLFQLPAEITVRRSKNDLQLRLIDDSVNIDYTVKSSPNPAFVYWNLLGFQACPAAYLIDLTTQKRFYYGRSILLDPNDSLRVITPRIRRNFQKILSKQFSKKSGQVDLKLSIPYVNSFSLQPENEGKKVNTGFWGVSVGFEYYHAEKQYLSLTGNAVSDFSEPVPAAVDHYGASEGMASAYLSLTNNHKVARFHFGYGVNFSRNIWQLTYSERFGAPPPTIQPYSRASNSLGITFNTYYQVSKHFLLGLVYRPTILRISPTTEFKYEHLISFDVGWRFGLKK